jgi:hypothetical protein
VLAHELARDQPLGVARVAALEPRGLRHELPDFEPVVEALHAAEGAGDVAQPQLEEGRGLRRARHLRRMRTCHSGRFLVRPRCADVQKRAWIDSTRRCPRCDRWVCGVDPPTREHRTCELPGGGARDRGAVSTRSTGELGLGHGVRRVPGGSRVGALARLHASRLLPVGAKSDPRNKKVLRNTVEVVRRCREPAVLECNCTGVAQVHRTH